MIDATTYANIAGLVSAITLPIPYFADLVEIDSDHITIRVLRPCPLGGYEAGMPFGTFSLELNEEFLTDAGTVMINALDRCVQKIGRMMLLSGELELPAC